MKHVLFLLLSLCCFHPVHAQPDAPKPGTDQRPARFYTGGETTVFDTSRNAFGRSAANLTRHHWNVLRTSKPFFGMPWLPPNSKGRRVGLGPFYNADSCAGCHFKDGRGRAPGLDLTTPPPMVFALSIPDGKGGVLPEPHYGNQFHDRAVAGVTPEGKVRVSWTEQTGQYPDGKTWRLRKPTFHLEQTAYGKLHPQTMISPRIPPQVFGLGLLEAIPQADILALADPKDRNKDGISGRANRTLNPRTQKKSLGRFGWKASKTTVEHQVAGAFLEDMGLTSTLFPKHPCGTDQKDCEERDTPKPELSDYQLERTVMYIKLLGVPGRRGADDAAVLKGETLFTTTGCADCHRPQGYRTAEVPRLPELSGQTIYPFTDLLLHDMGPDLADGRPDGEATGREWRTPPLWGIGLLATVDIQARYLHDGRAANLEEAILWHGGEAAGAQQNFRTLSAADRAALLAFLRSL